MATKMQRVHEEPTATAVDIERRLGLRSGAIGETLLGFLAALPAGLSIQDAGGRHLFVDQRLAEMLARPVESLIGGGLAQILGAANLASLREADRAALRQHGAQTRLHSMVIDGTLRRFAVTRVSMQAADQSVPALLCSIWQESDSGRRETFATAAPVVPPDRDSGGDDSAEAPVGQTLFDDQLRRELDLSGREHREFALVSLAIDRPGPAAAPPEEAVRLQIERTVDHLLRGNIRAMDSSFRVAANRFFMILSGVGLATAHSRVEALRRQCAEQRVGVGDAVHRFTISIGIASYPHTTRDRHEIVRASESALAVAQGRGGNHVALASIPFETR